MQQEKLHTPHVDVDNDELDLRDIIHTLIKQKKIIILVAGLAMCGSVLYALFATPVYKATVSFLPPTTGEVASLRIPMTGAGTDAGTDAMKIYAEFEKNLNSIKLRRAIFEKMNLLSAFAKNVTDNTNKEAVFSAFNVSIDIEKPTKKKEESVVPIIYLSLTGGDPKLLADILNQIERLVRDTTKKEVIDGVLKKVEFEKRQLVREIDELRQKAERQKQDKLAQLRETNKIETEKTQKQIDTLRNSAKTKRMDRITVLSEAAKVAESIGLIEKSSLLDATQVNTDRTAFYTEVNTQAQPLYLRGSKALRAEIQELVDRKSDDPFIPELRELEDKLEQLKTDPVIDALLARESNDPFIETLRDKESTLAILEAFKIDPERVSVATLDQAAFPPETREKPKRSLILALGAVGGLFLGIIAAFMVNFWQTLRLEDEGTV